MLQRFLALLFSLQFVKCFDCNYSNLDEDWNLDVDGLQLSLTNECDDEQFFVSVGMERMVELNAKGAETNREICEWDLSDYATNNEASIRTKFHVGCRRKTCDEKKEICEDYCLNKDDPYHWYRRKPWFCVCPETTTTEPPTTTEPETTEPETTEPETTEPETTEPETTQPVECSDLGQNECDTDSCCWCGYGDNPTDSCIAFSNGITPDCCQQRRRMGGGYHGYHYRHHHHYWSCRTCKYSTRLYVDGTFFNDTKNLTFFENVFDDIPDDYNFQWIVDESAMDISYFMKKWCFRSSKDSLLWEIKLNADDYEHEDFNVTAEELVLSKLVDYDGDIASVDEKFSYFMLGNKYLFVYPKYAVLDDDIVGIDVDVDDELVKLTFDKFYKMNYQCLVYLTCPECIDS